MNGNKHRMRIHNILIFLSYYIWHKSCHTYVDTPHHTT